MSETCRICGAKCCKYITIKIDAPRDKIDRDEIRWFLHHENISVMIERRLWFLQVYTRCKNLARDNRCAIYDNRPEVCRQYEMEECEHLGEEDEGTIEFYKPEEYDRFLEEKKKRRKKRRRKR